MTDFALGRTLIRLTYANVLPGKFDSPEATQLLLTIGGQESHFEHRQQVGGPARSFWQFERAGGCAEVLEKASTQDYAKAACMIRDVTPTAAGVYAAMLDDDLIGCAFARLLLYSDPKPLPDLGDIDTAFDYYVRNWRPGAYTRGDEAQRAKLRNKFRAYYVEARESAT